VTPWSEAAPFPRTLFLGRLEEAPSMCHQCGPVHVWKLKKSCREMMTKRTKEKLVDGRRDVNERKRKKQEGKQCERTKACLIGSYWHANQGSSNEIVAPK